MTTQRLLPIVVAGVWLAGCQASPSTTAPVDPVAEKPPRMHLHLSQASQAEGDITHIVQDISLVKAIKHVYPDATLLPDPGIDMQQRISLWVENATTAQYLDQVGRAAGLVIRHDGDTVSLSQVERWNFTLPMQHVGDVRELLSGSPQARMTVISNDDEVATVLVTASPSQLPALQTAVFQLSDQTTLNDTFSRKATDAGNTEG